MPFITSENLSRTAAMLVSVASIAFISDAQAKDTLTVYSYRQPFLVEPLFAEFEKQTGIDVQVLYAKKGLIERLELEGENGPADLLISNNLLRLIEAKEKNLTLPITQGAITDLVPENLMDADKHWLGLTRRGRIIYANENTVPHGSINDYLDLASADNNYKICLRPWRHSYNVGLLSYLIASIGEERTEEWVRAVVQKLGRKPQGNDRAQIKAVNVGECDLAIANSYYFGVMKADLKQIEHTKEVYSIFPTLNQVNGTFGSVSGISLLKSADDQATAVKLIEFMANDDAQKIYARNNHEFPASRAFTGMTNDEAKLDNRPLAESLQYRHAALDLIDRVITD